MRAMEKSIRVDTSHPIGQGETMRTFNVKKHLYSSALILLIGSAAYAEDGLFATQVQLDHTQISPGGWLQAFVPTGSDSEVCFVNLGDSGSLYDTLIEPPVCIRRTINGQKGVVIILMPWSGPLRPDLMVRVSLYQKGARQYGRPVYVEQF
jgi:hypothetical protein